MPAYQDYMVRTRITEGLGLVEPAKTSMAAEGVGLAARNGQRRLRLEPPGLPVPARTPSSWTRSCSPTIPAPATPRLANPELVITYNPLNVGVAAAQRTITLTPWNPFRCCRRWSNRLRRRDRRPNRRAGLGLLPPGAPANTAAARGITVTNFGTVLAKYAPAQCR
jgi:type IV pilus assembly protein PilA